MPVLEVPKTTLGFQDSIEKLRKAVILTVMVYDSEVKVAQSCPTLCDPMNYTVHGILQARVPQCVAFPFSRGSFQPRD